MASMRSIKRRKESVQSTQQITKAMKLVSTVKLQRAKTRAEQSKAYFECMYETVKSMLAKAGTINHPYLKAGESSKKAVVKLITKNEDLKKEDLKIYAIGKKGKDALERAGYEIAADYSDMIDEPVYIDAMNIANTVLKAFSDGEVGEIYLAYTAFKNTVVHIPQFLKLLPVSGQETEAAETKTDADDKLLMNFEPEETEALDLIIPKYITSLIFGGMVDAVASENGARMQAMDSATSNAEEMIDSLALQYNRARQGSITQELTEIIAGAEAIS